LASGAPAVRKMFGAVLELAPQCVLAVPQHCPDDAGCTRKQLLAPVRPQLAGHEPMVSQLSPLITEKVRFPSGGGVGVEVGVRVGVAVGVEVGVEVGVRVGVRVGVEVGV
jgi:hypothetical protein